MSDGSVSGFRVQLLWPKPAMDAKKQQASSVQALRDWIARTAPRVQSSLNTRLAVQVLRIFSLAAPLHRAEQQQHPCTVHETSLCI